MCYHLILLEKKKYFNNLAVFVYSIGQTIRDRLVHADCDVSVDGWVKPLEDPKGFFSPADIVIVVAILRKLTHLLVLL